MKLDAALAALPLPLLLLAAAAAAETSPAARPLVLVIHGGAGTITRARLTPEMEQRYRGALAAALRAGHAVLARGGSALDTVETVVRLMEDDPLFNAGKGAVFTHEGKNELDASIMDGRTRAAGAVAGVTIVKNPIAAARAVMERSKHVMMAGHGADLFATEMGLEVVDPSYFWTERRWKELQEKLLEEKRTGLDSPSPELGTVGALALDREGNLAAATSTGGMTNKRFGRVGDTPVIGAGTFADNASCAVSATGHGEFLLRFHVASDIAALLQYKGLTIQQAADEVVHGKLARVKGDAGVIALDAKGNFATPFNTEGMYRGWIRTDGVPEVRIYKD